MWSLHIFVVRGSPIMKISRGDALYWGIIVTIVVLGLIFGRVQVWP